MTKLELVRSSLVLLFLGLVIFDGFENGSFLIGCVGVLLWLPWLGVMLDKLL